ncbi:MAG: sigma-70 family RNA polymerase sigma factor [Candidatus Acidiferrum sp.]|jgi:RNA polymerase sigma-70 factor, ECF subfamily
MNVQEAAPIAGRRKDRELSAPEAASTDERLLVAEAKSGCPGAFGELYERHRLKICRTAFRILRNQEDAEDAVQRAFQRAFANLGRFREDSTFSTWVTRIAINEALMLLRQRRANTPLLEGNSDGDDVRSTFDPADTTPTPEQALAETERRAAVHQAISHLRESLRTVVLFRELQGLTSAETARLLGLTISAVKARTFHARRYLKRHLERKYMAPFTSF